MNQKKLIFLTNYFCTIFSIFYQTWLIFTFLPSHSTILYCDFANHYKYLYNSTMFILSASITIDYGQLYVYVSCREVESCGQLLASLGTCLHHLQTLLSWATPGELFPSEPHSPKELFSQADMINQYCFYGRCLGFQVCTCS